MVNFFFAQYMANGALIPKIPFFFLPNLGLGHLRGPGVSLGRISGSHQLSPFCGRGV